MVYRFGACRNFFLTLQFFWGKNNLYIQSIHFYEGYESGTLKTLIIPTGFSCGFVQEPIVLGGEYGRGFSSKYCWCPIVLDARTPKTMIKVSLNGHLG